MTMMFADALEDGWRRVYLAGILLAIAAVRAGAQDVSGKNSAWARAVDAYLAGAEDSVPSVLRLSTEEVTIQSREALDAWMASARAAEVGVNAHDERRLAIRRVQAAALLPLEILSLLSTRMRLLPPMKAYETAAMEAWKQLGDDDLTDPLRSGAEERARQRRFRTWWQIAYLQFLMNNARYGDFKAHAQQVRLAEGDVAPRVEVFLLRGMVEESIARLPAAEAVRRDNEEIEPESRLRRMTRTLEDAAGWYRRVLANAPAHLEATLHLGRVLVDLKQPQEALRTLQPLLTSPYGTTHCALASLFAGEAHEMLRANDDAAMAYAHAASLSDVRQSALVALMQLAVRAGDVATGARLIGHFAERTPLAALDGPDAWSVYLRGRRQNVNAVLRPLREAMVP
ncbi:hypothetical protein TBR22_A18800 [Luteitalea sp. TBR-22]|uniref:hypothetical protein n=1 Tax=Luteitalea sp. TBR-22 TaxID=2802971 RepID=UPI001AF9A777|nr:hypothetical protein [Luteitalea sp. TBR-22]BCS32666.1 hypothetical protein TBR22_A18800 [Luteitalea sp. TBR-22]